MEGVHREFDPPKPSTRLSPNTPTWTSLAAFRRTEPKRLGVLVQGELDWIVMKALGKDRRRRYETLTSLANDILAHLNGEPVQAAPPSTAYRIQKFVRKHRGPVLAVAAGAWSPIQLTPAQMFQIPEFLSHGAEAYGFRGDAWTCGRIPSILCQWRRRILRKPQYWWILEGDSFPETEQNHQHLKEIELRAPPRGRMIPNLCTQILTNSTENRPSARITASAAKR